MVDYPEISRENPVELFDNASIERFQKTVEQKARLEREQQQQKNRITLKIQAG